MFHLERSGNAVGVHLWHHHGAYRLETGERTFCPKRRQRSWVLTAAIVASSMGFMDRINIAIAMPMLREDIGATLTDAQWISNSYLLLMSSLILLTTAAGERFGLKRVLAVGILIFTAGALGCAAAHETGWLIAARAVQGVGAALMVPGALAIVAKAYPASERGKAIGLWAAASSLLLVVGPLAGGWLITTLGNAGWRFLFALNLPLGCLALFILLRHVPDDPPGEMHPVDLPGGLLATLALFLIAFGFTGGGDGQMQTAEGLFLFVGAGLLVLGLFVLRQSRVAHPIVPLALFRNRSFSGANAVTFLNDFAVSANLFFLPAAVIAGWGATAASASVLFLPLPILVTAMSEPSGQLTDRLGPAPLVTLGSVMVAAACAGLALTAGQHELLSTALPLMALMAFGQGLLVSPLSTAVMTSEPDGDAIVGSCVNNAVSRSAWLMSIAAMGGVAAMVFALHVAGTPAASSTTFGVAPAMPLAPSVEAVRVAASDSAYAAIAWTCSAMAVLSAAIAAFTLEWKLNRSPVAAN